ncbi:hypothetical protein NDU88_006995 [Pleurodeles waltl]|uniref:Uncharacterized protein n=1 Tax=Pleurodeles waltl TaxID=8319 RepID=A0AAV7QJC7_PLEWA|nr:hypothetical protein NDU88_006995 [Pleurodeles waltl]
MPPPGSQRYRRQGGALGRQVGAQGAPGRSGPGSHPQSPPLSASRPQLVPSSHDFARLVQAQSAFFLFVRVPTSLGALDCTFGLSMPPPKQHLGSGRTPPPICVGLQFYGGPGRELPVYAIAILGGWPCSENNIYS